MTYFRSELMSFFEVMLQSEFAYNYITQLGNIGCVKFSNKTSNNSSLNVTQRRNAGDFSLCVEIENRLYSIEQILRRYKIPLLDISYESTKIEAPSSKEIDEIDNFTKKVHEEIEKIETTQKLLKHNLLDLIQLREVLMRITRYNYKNDLEAAFSFQNISDIPELPSLNMTFVVGMIQTDKFHVFHRILWRLTRGLMIFYTETVSIPLEDVITGEIITKSFFIVLVQGKELVTRVKKLCFAYNAQIYEISESETKREQSLENVITDILDMRLVIRKTTELQIHTLNLVAKSLQKWKIQIIKAKHVFMIITTCLSADTTDRCLIGEIFIPNKEIKNVQKTLSTASKAVNSAFEPILNPITCVDDDIPTFFTKNKFLQGFQALVEAYGIPNYREINPSVFTIVTFPFLFAVMFGDIGHGLLLTILGLWMVLKEHPLAHAKSRNEIWNILYNGRYIIALCGCFSIYAGFIYNDIFSKSFNFFGSRWKIHYNYSTIHENHVLQLDPNSLMFEKNASYPFGIDPVWQLAHANKIIFQNAFKMKISIIFGVIHMLFAIILSFFNNLYFKNYLGILTEFIPQIIFLSSIFLYLVFLMFYKWLTFTPADANCAPSLLITFINMLMFKKTEAMKNCDPFLFPSQEFVQITLVYVSLLCIPWMLLTKPLYIYFIIRKNGDEDDDNDEEEPLSEIFIHQAIHTIEFVLGSVSHTASYLRLWALSLAHSQLTEVLWRMILTVGIQSSSKYLSGVMLYMIFAIWAAATVAILVVMEGLSAFLHTLRLHWVEFQSKFYMGQGVKFEPFSFEKILKEELN